MSARQTTEKSLFLLRALPRVSLGNIRDNPGANQSTKRGRGQHGGDKHGDGNKGGGQRQNFMRLGYETGNTPFYLRFPCEPYYKGHHLRRQYLPFDLQTLQLWIDTERVDSNRCIDITSICNTGLYRLLPDEKQFGFQLNDEGVENFKAKIHIEVQHATELAIAAIERNGGVIRTAYYDTQSLWALKNAEKFFTRGTPIPKRMLPPQDAVEYYTDPKNRGYLADPEAISHERFVLAQKYGYELPKIEEDPKYEMFNRVKDPRQVFYGLEPGWVVNLVDKVIMKPILPQEEQSQEATA